jgi:hypothetical protein
MEDGEHRTRCDTNRLTDNDDMFLLTGKEHVLAIQGRGGPCQ